MANARDILPVSTSMVALTGLGASVGEEALAVPQTVPVGPPVLAGTWGQGVVPSLDLALVEYNSTWGVRIRQALYKMRGRKGDGSFEVWMSLGTPNPVSPRGTPLTEVVVSDVMVVVSR